MSHSESVDEAGPSNQEKPTLFTSNISSLFELKGELYRKKHEQRVRNAAAQKPRKVPLLFCLVSTNFQSVFISAFEFWPQSFLNFCLWLQRLVESAKEKEIS